MTHGLNACNADMDAPHVSSLGSFIPYAYYAVVAVRRPEA